MVLLSFVLFLIRRYKTQGKFSWKIFFERQTDFIHKQTMKEVKQFTLIISCCPLNGVLPAGKPSLLTYSDEQMRWIKIYPLRCRGKNPQWGNADAEIKDTAVENPQLIGPPFKALHRSKYSHACFTHCQGFLPWTDIYALGPFTCIFSKPLRVFPVLVVAITDSCVGPQIKIGHRARRSRWVMQVPTLSAPVIWIGSKACVTVFCGFAFRNREYGCWLSEGDWCVL